MKRFSILLLFSLFISSCTATEVSPTAKATSVPTLTPSATATETPLPTFTLTPTLPPTPALSPDTMIYHFAPNVSQEEQALVREGVRIARYYLINNFGHDIEGSYAIRVINDPSQTSPKDFARVNYYVMTINVGHHWWKEYDKSGRLKVVIHEFTHLWQGERGNGFPGCGTVSDYVGYAASHDPMTSIMAEGHAEYVAFYTVGLEGQFTIENLHPIEVVDSFDQRFTEDSALMAAAVEWLIQRTGPMAFTNYCDQVGQGKTLEAAFESAFDMPVEDFVSQFKDYIVELAKAWKRSVGMDVVSLNDLLDPSATEPNLTATFMDENGDLAILENIHLCKQTINLPSACRGPEVVPGVFSAALLPGRYAFYFCGPGYPGDQSTFKCKGYETDWFDISEKQLTSITFHIPAEIENADLPAPNLVVRFFDHDGEPIPELFLQICNYDSGVKVCTAPNEKTDSQGIYKGFFTTGKFMLRFGWPSFNDETLKHYEIDEINVSETSVTKLSYQFPAPNLTVKFTDSVGGLLPNHEFVLCRAAQSAGNCSGTANLWGWWVGTNDEGVFEAHVEPGMYLIVTNQDNTNVELRVDYKIPINVTGETEVTTIEYPLFK